MPSQNNLHIDANLTNVSVAFLQSSDAFVASKVFPSIPVSHQSDKYVYYPPGTFTTQHMKPRADATESAGFSYDVSEGRYFAETYGLHFDIGKQMRANADEAFTLELTVTEQLTQQALMKKEQDFTEKFLTAGEWATDIALGTPWSDDASDPIKNIRDAATQQQKLTGRRPNYLVVSRDTYDALSLNPAIIDRVKYGTQTNVSYASTGQMADLFEVADIYISEAITNVGAPGADQNAFINSGVALLGYRTRQAGILQPTGGYTFSWNELGGEGSIMKKYWINQIEATRVEIELSYDMKVVAPEMGTLFTNTVA